MRNWMRLLLIAGGVLSFRLTAWTLFRSDALEVSASSYLFSNCAEFLAVALVAVLGRLNCVTPRRAAILSVVAAVVMTGSAVSVCASLSSPMDEALARFLCACHGVAGGVLFVGWGSVCCTCEPNDTAVSLTAAFLCYSLLTWLLASLPADITVACCIASPMVTTILLVVALRCLPCRDFEYRGIPEGTVARFPWPMFAVLFVCAATVALMSAILPPAVDKGQFTFNAFWPPLFLLACSLVLLSLLVSKKRQVEWMWVLFSFIITCGLAGFSSLSFIFFDAAISFMQATQECLLMFCFILVASTVYQLGLPVVSSFCVGALVLMMPEPVLSTMVEGIISPLSIKGNETIAAFAALFMAVLLMAFTFAVLLKQVMKRSPNVVVATDIEDRVESLARRFDLSPREKEVASLLLQGYTMPDTASTLFISLDTVRTHARHIYQKVGISSKRELIEAAKKAAANNSDENKP